MIGRLLCHLGFHKTDKPAGGVRTLWTLTEGGPSTLYAFEIYSHCLREKNEDGHLKEVYSSIYKIED